VVAAAGFADCSSVLPVYIGDDRTDEDAFKVHAFVALPVLGYLLKKKTKPAETVPVSSGFAAAGAGRGDPGVEAPQGDERLLLAPRARRGEHLHQSTSISLATKRFVPMPLASYPALLSPPSQPGHARDAYALPPVRFRRRR
jgi:hypothetical protein